MQVFTALYIRNTHSVFQQNCGKWSVCLNYALLLIAYALVFLALYHLSPLPFDNITPAQTIPHMHTKTCTRSNTHSTTSLIQASSTQRRPRAEELWSSLHFLRVEEIRGGRLKEYLIDTYVWAFSLGFPSHWFKHLIFLKPLVRLFVLRCWQL